MNKTKIKFIKLMILFLIMLIVVWISNVFYYKKIESMSNGNKIVEYELDSKGYEKVKEIEE